MKSSHGRGLLKTTSALLALCLGVSPAGASWMGELLADPVVGPQFANTRLSDVIFPGTHDSGCYEGIVPMGATKWEGGGKLDAFCATSGPFGAAQSRDLGGQLADGVRSLDIRTYWDTDLQSVYVEHNGCRYTGDVLSDLADFLAQPGNENEIVIFHFFFSTLQPWMEALDTQPAAPPFGDLYNTILQTIFEFDVGDGTKLGDHFVPWKHPSWSARQRWKKDLFGDAEVYDPTVQQVLDTGRRVIFMTNRKMHEAYDEGLGDKFNPAPEHLAHMWQSADGEASFFGINCAALPDDNPVADECVDNTDKGYPTPGEMDTEGRVFLLMQTAAAERQALQNGSGGDAPAAHRYLSNLGIHGGSNDLTELFQLDAVADIVNPTALPQLASLPRNRVNIVSIDFYHAGWTPWFVRLNRGVARVEVKPSPFTAELAFFGELGTYDDDLSAPDFYPTYVFGDGPDSLGQQVINLFGTNAHLGPAFGSDHLHRDLGGGPQTRVEDEQGVTLFMSSDAGGWEFRRFAEVYSSSPVHLHIGFSEFDSSGSYDKVTIVPGGWSYYEDLRDTVTGAAGATGTRYSSGQVQTSGDADTASGSAHMALFSFETTVCEWGVNCPDDEASVVAPVRWFRVPEGRTLDLSGLGDASVYSSAVAGLYWDTDTDGVPFVHTTPAAEAVFDATDLSAGPTYEISLAIVRTAGGLFPEAVLDSAVFKIKVCPNADGDDLIDGNPEPGVCPDEDPDEDNDGVLDEDDVCPGGDDTEDADDDDIPDACDTCTPCSTDGDDCKGGNSCVALTSGSYCLASCTDDPSSCPADTVCMDGACTPDSGDCGSGPADDAGDNAEVEPGPDAQPEPGPETVADVAADSAGPEAGPEPGPEAVADGAGDNAGPSDGPDAGAEGSGSSDVGADAGTGPSSPRATDDGCAAGQSPAGQWVLALLLAGLLARTRRRRMT